MKQNELACEDCKIIFCADKKEDETDYNSVFQTGVCGACLVTRVENGEDW